MSLAGGVEADSVGYDRGDATVTSAVLIHDDACARAYVYLDGALVLDVAKSDSGWQAQVSDTLRETDEVVESENTVDCCGMPPPELFGWSGLEAVERAGDGSLQELIGLHTLGCVATLIFNDEYIFGEDVFFPDDLAGW